MKPYTEKVNHNIILREFDHSVDDIELVWHRDDCDRIVEIIESNGWKFQYDNQLPIPLNKGDIINIKKDEWHRTIKGDGKLIIKITNL